MAFGSTTLSPRELVPHPALKAPEWLALAAEGRRAPARTRTPGTRVNPQVGRELKPCACLLRLMPPTPGSGEQNNEHSALESNLYYNKSHAAISTTTIIRAVLRSPSAITGCSPGSGEQNNEHSALESNLIQVAMPLLLEPKLVAARAGPGDPHRA